METNHDAIRHLRYLRQSLSQDNEPVGFFLSAGCPLSVDMPAEKWPLIPDVANLTKDINSTLNTDSDYTILLEELKKAGGNTSNIEDILSFMRGMLAVSKGGEVRGLSENKLKKLETTICNSIVKKINVALPSNETPYHRLGKWIRSIDRKIAVEIFTTNYDLLTEQALEHLEIPYFDGFVGSCKPFFDLRALEDNLIPVHWTRLWKIHGSINWKQEGHESQKRVYRQNEATETGSHLIYPSHLKYDESRKMPYLALIDQLNRFIRKKSSFLIISGYSFSDNHLNDVIIGALKANPTGMVLGLMHGNYKKNDENNQTTDRYPEAYRLASNQHNLNIWAFDKAIIGTNLGSWAESQNSSDADSDLRSFISRETKKLDDDMNLTSLQVKLGDFSVFTNFLQRIIGTPKELKNV